MSHRTTTYLVYLSAFHVNADKNYFRSTGRLKLTMNIYTHMNAQAQINAINTLPSPDQKPKEDSDK